MAERIDIVVQASQSAPAGSRGGGQSLPGIPNIPSPKPMPDPTPQARKGINDLAQGVLNLQAAFAGLAVVQVGQQLIGWGTAAAQAAMQLEKVESTAKLLTGTTKGYNDLMALAKENQKLFGGSLAENIQGLSGFANTARKSGVDLAAFNDLATRLNLLDPAQGMEGAAVALKEAMSGDTQSLVERYELPRAALAKLKDANMTAADRVKFLSQMLTDQGVAAGAAASTVSETAKSYNALGAEVDGLTTKFGKLVADGFAPAARGATIVIQRSQDAVGGIASFGDKLDQVSRQALTGATSYDDYVARIALINQQLYAGIPVISTMTEAQYAQTRATLDASAAADAQTAAEQGRAASTQASAQAAFGWVNASNAAAKASKDAADAAQKDALSKIEQGAQSAINAAKQAELDRALRAAAASSDTASVAALKLASVYGNAQYPELLKVIGLLREKAALEGGSTAPPSRGGNDAADRADAAKAANYQRQLQDQITEATGSTADKLKLVNEQLKHATPQSQEAMRLEVEKARLIKQQADERARDAAKAAKANARDDKAMARAYEQEFEAARDAAQRVERLQQDHLDKLKRMTEDYQLSQSRGQEDYERQRQRLLAEGKIKEAQLLGEEYAIKSRRAAQDEAIARRREGEQSAQQVAETQAKAAQDAQDRATKRAQDGVSLPGGAAAAAQAGAAAPAMSPSPAAPSPGAVAGAVPAAAGGGLTLAIQIAPLAIQIGPEQIITATWPLIEQRMDAALTGGLINVALTAAPQIRAGGVGGPTP